MELQKQHHHHQYSWLPNQGHIHVAKLVDDIAQDIENDNKDYIPIEIELKLSTAIWTYRLGCVLLILVNQIALYSLYLTILSGNIWAITYIVCSYISGQILLLYFDIGLIHEIKPKIYFFIKLINNLSSLCLTGSLYLFLAGLKKNNYAQLGVLALSTLLMIWDFDNNMRNYFVMSIAGLAFAGVNIPQHLVPGRLPFLISSFILSIFICPFLSDVTKRERFKHYYWITQSLNQGVEIVASALLLLSVVY